jgi:glycine cleavage system H protein
MKEIDELSFPGDRRYSDDHEWALPAGELIRVGVSDYAQDQLGDIVFVELPIVGARFGCNEPLGVLESVKSVSDIRMPVGGEIMSINTALEAEPALVNSSPYDRGWLVEVKPENTSEFDKLMDASAYSLFLKGEQG